MKILFWLVASRLTMKFEIQYGLWILEITWIYWAIKTRRYNVYIINKLTHNSTKSLHSQLTCFMEQRLLSKNHNYTGKQSNSWNNYSWINIIYSTLAELLEIVPCFLDFHDIRESPSLIMNSVTNLRVCKQAPQSESQ